MIRVPGLFEWVQPLLDDTWEEPPTPLELAEWAELFSKLGWASDQRLGRGGPPGYGF
jgi:hypothetical protein